MALDGVLGKHTVIAAGIAALLLGTDKYQHQSETPAVQIPAVVLEQTGRTLNQYPHLTQCNDYGTHVLGDTAAVCPALVDFGKVVQQVAYEIGCRRMTQVEAYVEATGLIDTDRNAIIELQEIVLSAKTLQEALRTIPRADCSSDYRRTPTPGLRLS